MSITINSETLAIAASILLGVSEILASIDTIKPNSVTELFISLLKGAGQSIATLTAVNSKPKFSLDRLERGLQTDDYEIEH